MNAPRNQRIKPIKQVYVQHPFSKSKRSKLSKGNRELTVRTFHSNQKHFSSKNIHSISLKTQVIPFTVRQLKSLSTVQSISVDLSMQQAHQIGNALRLLKAFKRLRIITLDAQDFIISIEPNLLWLDKLFKLFHHQLINIKFLNIPLEIMNKQRLPKFIHRISSLKQIVLDFLHAEIEEDHDISISNFTSFCHILAAYHSKPLDLRLNCFAYNINTFLPQLLFCLSPVKNVDALAFTHCWKNPGLNMRQIQENPYPSDIDFLPLFSPHKKLTQLYFSALYNASIVKFFTFEELQELKHFSIDPGSSHQLNDNDFEIWVTRLRSCKKLQNLYFILRDCPLLTDVSVKNFSKELLRSLPDLESLSLALGYAPHASGMLPIAWTPPKCQYTPLAINYLSESLPFMERIRRVNLGFQIKEISDLKIKSLFDALSKQKVLEALDISVFTGSITDSISSSIKECLQSLMYLQTFALALRNCEKITNLFLEDLSSAFTIKKASKSLRTIQMNFENSKVSRESIHECSSFIKTQLPYCRICILHR